MAQGTRFSLTENTVSVNAPELTEILPQVNGNRRPAGRPPKYRTEAERKQAAVKRVRACRARKKKLVHFKSETVEWETPEQTFGALDAVFHFETDVCADATNAKCARYFTKEQDGLMQQWTGMCWMNPPYGAAIDRWVQKAYESSLWGTTVVCLLPARTDTRWWQAYVLPLIPDYVVFLPGRQYFSGKGRAPFPSAVVIFWPYLQRRLIEGDR
jgi:phage N-6-adenine-methyltransferase